MSSKDIASRARKLKALKAKQDEIAAEIAAIEQELKTELEHREVDELQAGSFKIRWKLIEGSRFDTKAFRAAMPELADRFTIKTTQRRFSLA